MWRGKAGVEVNANEARVPITVVHMVLSLVFGGHVQESIVLAAGSTKKHTIDIMEHGDTEREPGKFLLASVKRILNQDRRGAGLDRLKLTSTPL